MIVLDTNVVSEAIKQRPDDRVIAWLDDQIAETLYLTATSLSELLVGVAILPDGKRREHLAERLDALVRRLFADRVLAFDRDAARVFASLGASARLKGYTATIGDAQIAAVARLHGFTVATRDTTPFGAMGVPVVDPWLHPDE